MVSKVGYPTKTGVKEDDDNRLRGRRQEDESKAVGGTISKAPTTQLFMTVFGSKSVEIPFKISRITCQVKL